MMSDNRIVRLRELQKELEELEKDPGIQNLMGKNEELQKVVSDLDLTNSEAAEMIMPRSVANPEGPMVELSGRTRMPNSPGKKMLLQDDLKAVRDEVDRLLARLEDDSAVQIRTLLLEEISKMGVSPVDAAEFLAPGTYERSMKASAVKQKPSGRRVRTWENPYTGERVEAKATSNKRLRAWVSEHGEDILEQWLVDGA